MDKNYKFLSLEGGRCLTTNDEWKTFAGPFNYNDVDKNKYKKEENQFFIVPTKIRHVYGDLIKKIIFDEFEKINEIHIKKFGKNLDPNAGYGEFFEIFSIAVWHNQSYEDVMNFYWIKGSFDGKIDAIYNDKNDAYIYQIKLTNLAGDINVVDTMKENIRKYEQTGKLDNNASNLKYFLDKNFENIKYKSRHFLTISYDGRNDDNISPKQVFDKFLKFRLQKTVSDSKVGVTFNSINRCMLKVDEKRKELFMFVNAKNLIDSFEDYKKSNSNDFSSDSLFVKNVRGKMRTNSKMLDTIKNEPNLFSFYNNGISILCDFNNQDGCPSLTIFKPIIINGQQTYLTLRKAYIEDKNNIDKVSVPVFLKQVSTNTELQNIAKFNNSQAKIDYIDFLSIDTSLKRIQGFLLENITSKKENNERIYYLDLNSSGKIEAKEKAENFFGKESIVKLSDFIKLYSTIKNPKEAGKWKNSVNSMIKKYYSSGFDEVTYDVSIKICASIVETRTMILTNKFKVADLVIQYLKFLDISEDNIKIVIDEMLAKHAKSGKAKADIFRSNDTYDNLKQTCSDLNIYKWK